jgi:hypothetical protein
MKAKHLLNPLLTRIAATLAMLSLIFINDACWCASFLAILDLMLDRQLVGRAVRRGRRKRYERELSDETCHGTDYWWPCRCIVRRRISLLSEKVELKK